MAKILLLFATFLSYDLVKMFELVAPNFFPFNALTTHDAFWHRQILATRYQLAQSILKIGSALAERVR